MADKPSICTTDLQNHFAISKRRGLWLTSQIRRAAASVPTNVSEGCGRTSDKEFNYFLNIALGSANETEYLLILSKDLNYITSESFEKLNHEINIIKSKIYTLKQKLIQP